MAGFLTFVILDFIERKYGRQFIIMKYISASIGFVGLVIFMLMGFNIGKAIGADLDSRKMADHSWTGPEFRQMPICIGKEDPPKGKVEDGKAPECFFYYNEKTDTFFNLGYKETKKGNVEMWFPYREYKKKRIN